ncbi:hypothetical protein [Shewanella waksmanii]|uniref:hypothetical protein n=1 Tax=Shewanella waksmanii TaxID=213783 RepID=UPI003736F103
MSAYANRAIKAYQRKKQISQALSENEHTLVQMNSEEFTELVISHKQKQGLTKQQAIRQIGELIANASPAAKQYWDNNRDDIKTVSGLIPVFGDGIALSALAIEMQRGGNVFSRYKIVNYSGKANIIFQGYAGLRKDLTGTRYLASNPKVISMGIGKLGALKSITKGGVITLLISAGFHGFDQLMNDKKTWHHFVGGMAVDTLIAAGGMVASWSAIAIAGGISTAVISGMIIVVLAGAVIGGLAYFLIDTKYWSERMAEALMKMEVRLAKDWSQAKSQIQKANRQYHDDPILFLHRLFNIPYYGAGF